MSWTSDTWFIPIRRGGGATLQDDVLLLEDGTFVLLEIGEWILL